MSSHSTAERRRLLESNGPSDPVLILSVIDAAKAANRMSYARTTGFHMGAALLSTSGSLHVGCRVENERFDHIRAESAALSALVVSGERSAALMALVASTTNGTPELLLPSIDVRHLYAAFSRHPGLELRVIVPLSLLEVHAMKDRSLTVAQRLSEEVRIGHDYYALVPFGALRLPEDDGPSGDKVVNLNDRR